tara:strand:+ start:547 stop:747 length:201 start_codon:yes stop_codon:yes gene_type:complete
MAKWEDCIKDLKGRKVRITKVIKQGINTNGREGDIMCFDRKANKYQISFSPSACGWYLRSEFELLD